MKLDFAKARKPYTLPTTWSPQQAAFIDWAINGKGSCVLEAVAGSGKTTTVLAAATQMSGKIAILAYNNKIAAEIKGKVEDLGISWQQVNAGTVHSFGFKALRKFWPNVQVDEKKVDAIIEELAPESPFGPIVKQLVSLAKQSAVGVIHRMHDTKIWEHIVDHFDLLDDPFTSEDTPDIIALAIRVLKASNAMTGVVDFDDMVYLPLVLPCKHFRYNAVFVDEAQDTNPARRELVKRLMMPGARLIAVGDKHQAIYGFTGADNDSLDLIVRDFNAICMPLTVTYRCPKNIVAFAQQWVSHIQAADTAIDGEVSSAMLPEIIEKLRGEQAAILCRNVKPLVSVAFKLIKARIACRIEGRDIGKGLIKLATKWKSAKLIATYEEKLEKHLENSRRNFKDKPMKLQMIEDQCEVIKLIMSQCRAENKERMTDVVDWLNEMFADDVVSGIVLSTIHKSKGREWKNVYWLDRARTLPSRYAEKQWQLEQEANLCYVAATRAEERLTEIVWSGEW